MILKYIAAVFIGYLLGSVNFAVLLSSVVQKKDVRSFGSGNAGATNMARTFGLGPGLATMAGDMAKTSLAIFLCRLLIGDAGIATAGLGCLTGHCFPVFYGFKGGKGVAVGAMIILFAAPAVFPFVLLVFLFIALTTGKVSLSSVCAAASGAFLVSFSQASLCSKAGVFAAAVTIILCHRQNIVRLINGTEPDFTLPAKHKT